MKEIRDSLAAYIQDWIESHAEDDSWNWSDYWCDENLHKRMADAAVAVFMAARQAQVFAKEQEKK